MCEEAYLSTNPNSIQSAENGTTWLMHFCDQEDLDAIQFFLINSKDLDLEKRDNKGRTVLLRCVCKNNIVMTELLLEAGSDVNIRDRGFTPLLKALENDDSEIARLLLRYDADINVAMNDGTTPLMLACFNCSDDEILLIKALINNQTYIDAIDELDQTALEMCIGGRLLRKALGARIENNEIIKLLVSMGGHTEKDYDDLLKEILQD